PNDLLFIGEAEDKPLYDISIADVVTWKVHPSFDFGVGVNFHRAIAADPDATSPGKDCQAQQLGPYAGFGPSTQYDNPCFIVEKDALGNPTDTITGSLAGTKLMTRFRLDPKVWFGTPESLGGDELVLYGEA